MTDIYELSDLEILARDSLTRAGVSHDVARVVARDVALAEASGLSESGFQALLRDIRLIRYGRLLPDAMARVKSSAPTVLRIHAGHGFAAAAIAGSLPELERIARTEGMAMIHLSHASDPGATVAALTDLAKLGLAALSADGQGGVHAIRPGSTQPHVVSGPPQDVLSAMLSLAPPPSDSPLDGPVRHSAWVTALDPKVSAAEEMMARLPTDAPARTVTQIALPADLLAQIVTA